MVLSRVTPQGSANTRTPARCRQIADYVDSTLGPYVQELLRSRPLKSDDPSEDVPFPNFAHEGAWTSHQLCSSPIFFKDKLYLVSSRIGKTHSFFCVFDAASGATVSCPDESQDHFFFSSIVDHTRGADAATVWVFGSAWNRANKSAVGVSATAEQRARSSTIGWGSGPCDDASRGEGPGCHVGAWRSTDMKSWTFSKAVTLPLPQTTANPGASMIPLSSQPTPAAGLPRHQAFMAMEGGVLAINTGSDGDLHQSWELLSNGSRTGGFALPCPSARYNPQDRWYYVFGGGVDIQLRRSRNLAADSWSAPVLMATGCDKSPGGNSRYNQSFADCIASPGNNLTRVAPGYFTEYWQSNRAKASIPFLKNMSSWDWGTSDADFTDEGGRGPTRFIFEQNWQGKPPGWEGEDGGFYQVGLFAGTEFEFLSSFFKSDDADALAGNGPSAAPAINMSALVPMPQCVEQLSGSPSMTLSSSWVIVSASGNAELGFAAHWLQTHLAAPPLSLQLTHVPTAKLPASQFFYLGVPSEDAELAALLQKHNVALNASRLGTEGYVLASVGGGVVLAAPTQAGVFHSVQTLLQLPTVSGGSVSLPACRIEDWPDSPDRAVYMYGSDYDNPGWNPAMPPGTNKSGRGFIASVIERMALLKLNVGVFDGDGGKHFFQAMLDEDELGHKTTPGAFATNLSWYKNEMQRRHIEFVPDISCDSGGPAAIVPNVADGLYVQDEPFTMGDKPEEPAVPVREVLSSLPANGDFKAVQPNGSAPGWYYWYDPGSPKPEPAQPMAHCSANTSFGPSPGAHSMQCMGTGTGAVGGIYGVRSAPFAYSGGSFYA